MACAPSEDSDQHPPSLVRVFTVRMEKAWVLSYPLSPGWSESSLGAQSFCWFCHEAAHWCPWPIYLGKLENTGYIYSRTSTNTVKLLNIRTPNKIAVIILTWNSFVLLQGNGSKRCGWNCKQCRPWSEQSDLGLHCLPRTVCPKT